MTNVHSAPAPVKGSPVRIFTDLDHNRDARRSDLIDLLKPLTKDGPGPTYGDYYKRITLVDTPEDSDFCVLPMSLNYYSRLRTRKTATTFIRHCSRAGKRVLVLTNGDYGVSPWFRDNSVVLMRASGYGKRRQSNQLAHPAFIRDPLQEYFKGNLSTRSREAVPHIGFCGLAKCSSLRGFLETGRTIARNTSRYMGLSDRDPQHLESPTRLRSRLLDVFDDADVVETRFIRRDRYRAGARTDEERLRTAMEFYGNIRDTDYTVCIRGGGNFSVRLYETLAMGRIPVFLNTDCILPFDDIIPWKRHMVWIERKDMRHAARIVRDFHDKMTSTQFFELQQRNRDLWRQYLSFSGFHDRLLDHMTA